MRAESSQAARERVQNQLLLQHLLEFKVEQKQLKLPNSRKKTKIKLKLTEPLREEKERLESRKKFGNVLVFSPHRFGFMCFSLEAC